MDEVIFSQNDIVKIDSKIIQDLKQKALKNKRKRVRLCLHKNTQALLHEMIVVICKDAYTRPHKHINKVESFHIIEGSFYLVVFNQNGSLREKFIIRDGKAKDCFLCRIEKDYWHMLIPISDFVVFHETTQGPFINGEDRVFASWSPEEDDLDKIDLFLKKVLG